MALALPEVRSYVDGVLEASKISQPMILMAANFVVAGLTVGGVPIGFFEGLIDDVRLYDHELSEVEVMDNFLQCAPANPGPPLACKDCSSCPWDCGDFDGNVGIVDFRALLAQWGGPGSCDFDGGGVGINDFLALLGNWGPCP